MLYKKIRLLMLAATFCIGAAATAFGAGSGPDVRIGIREGQGSATITSSAPVTAYRNDVKWKTYAANTSIPVAFKNGAIYVSGASSNVPVQFKTNNGQGMITLGSHAYRGSLEFVKLPTRWGMTIVNELPLEQYLYGVVGKEMSPGWATEALKAQAVAARTYAMSHRGYFRSRGFDMTDDTYSQTYGGVAAESPSVTQAVDATRGEIITYNGKAIDALYSTTAGGWTEHSENVWGDVSPYLRGVSDPSDKMPGYRWQVSTTLEAMAQRLEDASKGVGKIYAVIITPLAKRPMNVADRGISGRVKSMTFVGSQGRRVVTGNAFQQIYGLRSTLFDFYQGTVPANIDAYKPNRGNTLTFKAGVPVVIAGYGWGHGLGMSQWGAYQMAEENKGKANFYRTILMHYYSNTRIEKLY